MTNFKSGFVNIIGYPNAGKSTLLNAFMKEKLSIVTPKIQTTRTRITGLLNGENYQVVFGDTPGILDPRYELQKTMISSIEEALEDADIILYITEAGDRMEKHTGMIEKIKNLHIPVFLLINKVDLVDQQKIESVHLNWQKYFTIDFIYVISALHDFNITQLLEHIIKILPENPPYFDTETLTDRSERFVASEIIREKIFLNYKEEIPYSSEVIVISFKEEETIIRISAEIFVERDTQKSIIIGKSGSALKKTGTEARLDMEKFFNKKIYLELFVKVRENWRNNKNFLKKFGYLH